MGKFLTAICLVSFISLSTASLKKSKFIPWELGECLINDYIQIKEFDAEKFFNGTWYELFNYETYLFDMKGKCTALQSKISDNNVDILFYQYSYNQSKWETLKGFTLLKEMEGSEFMVQYPTFDELHHITIPYSVVYTDYDNYAVFYSCQSIYGMKLEMSWVSTRQRGDLSKYLDIEQVLARSGLNFILFDVSVQESCDHDEPKL
uniref:Putative pallidipin-like lipocalin n=1 Tax=Panstrongylus lignarius TaxID=156445 RepID=A0A224XY40_9HEMI